MNPSQTVTIVSAWLGHPPHWLKRVEENHRDFASKFGFKYMMLGDSDFSGFKPLQYPTYDDYSWLKVEAIRAALTDSDFAFWIDADSVFVEPFQDLSRLLPRKQSITFTGDKNDLCNGGHLIFRNSEYSWGFLEEWDSLRNFAFPKLNTTMQTAEGFIGDQVGLNYLLAGGVADSKFVHTDGARLFNRVNGWTRNPDRANKFFQSKLAPVSRRNVRRASKLIPAQIRRNFKVVEQHLLNAYPWWGSASNSGNRPGPIVHFVGPWKDMLTGFPDHIPNWK